MEVIQQVEAPKALVDLIYEHYEPIYTIKRVLLLNDDPFNLANGHMGVYIPEQEAVLINMKACMEDQRWMQRGMSFVANVWCNLLYTVFHEGAHAMQMINEEIVFDEATWSIQHEMLDHAAHITAMEQLIDWFNVHTITPPLEQLGWVGERIQKVFNNIYSEAPDAISLELDLLGTEAGGLAMGAAQDPSVEDGDIQMLNLPQEYKDAPAGARLLEAVDRGDIGLKVNGRPCLRIGDFIEVIANRNRS